MNDSVKIVPRGGAFGLYRLMLWDSKSMRYVFFPHTEDIQLRIGCACLRPHSLEVCKRLRLAMLENAVLNNDDFGLPIIITPYPI